MRSTRHAAGSSRSSPNRPSAAGTTTARLLPARCAGEHVRHRRSSISANDSARRWHRSGDLGLFFYGDSQVQVASSNGNLCVAAPPPVPDHQPVRHLRQRHPDRGLRDGTVQLRTVDHQPATPSLLVPRQPGQSRLAGTSPTACRSCSAPDPSDPARRAAADSFGGGPSPFWMPGRQAGALALEVQVPGRWPLRSFLISARDRSPGARTRGRSTPRRRRRLQPLRLRSPAPWPPGIRELGDAAVGCSISRRNPAASATSATPRSSPGSGGSPPRARPCSSRPTARWITSSATAFATDSRSASLTRPRALAIAHRLGAPEKLLEPPAHGLRAPSWSSYSSVCTTRSPPLASATRPLLGDALQGGEVLRPGVLVVGEPDGQRPAGVRSSSRKTSSRAPARELRDGLPAFGSVRHEATRRSSTM